MAATESFRLRARAPSSSAGNDRDAFGAGRRLAGWTVRPQHGGRPSSKSNSMTPPPGNPPRKPVVIAEATQELRAADVIGVLDRIETAGSVSGVSLPHKS